MLCKLSTHTASYKIVSSFIVVSKRIEIVVPDDVHAKLLGRCDKIGCDITDYMKASVEYVLEGTSSFDFGEEEKT